MIKRIAMVLVLAAGCGGSSQEAADVGPDIGSAAGSGGSGGGAAGAGGGGMAGAAGTGTGAGGAVDAGVPPYDGGGTICNQPAGSVWLADQCTSPSPTGKYCRANCRYYDHTSGALISTANAPCVQVMGLDPRFPELCVADCSQCP